MKHFKRCYGCMELLKDEGSCSNCKFDIKKYNADARCMPLGSQLHNRYIIGKVLGEGGFGITYIGWDTVLDLPVAIKEYFPAGLAGRENINPEDSHKLHVYEGKARQNFQVGLKRSMREAKTLARFHNASGIVEIRDFFYDNETAYIIMEYIDGITIKEYIRYEGRMKPHQVFELIRPVMRSLELIHREGMIHRDISPDNIMLTKEGNVKLIDFGATRMVNNDSGKSMTIMLKRGFAPIEQYMESSIQGPYTDVYGLCATIYYMLTGKTPPESMSRLVNDKLNLLEEYDVELPKYQEKAIMKGLQVKEEDRFATVKDLYEALYRSEIDQSMELENATELFSFPVLHQRILEHTQKTNARYGLTDTLQMNLWQKEKSWQQPVQPTIEKRQTLLVYLKERTKRRKQIAGISILCLLIILAGGILWINADYFTKETKQTVEKVREADSSQTIRVSGPVATVQPTAIPGYEMVNVTGKTVTSAKREINNMGDFSLAIKIKKKYNDSVKKGNVFEQSIASGTHYQKGEYQEIVLTVSKGPRKVKVPSVTGLSVGSAKKKLKKQGLKTKVIRQYSNYVQKDFVISQDVEGNKKVKKNRVITLTVSLGKAPEESKPSRPKATPKTNIEDPLA